MFEALESHDIGCGMGGERNVEEVFKVGYLKIYSFNIERSFHILATVLAYIRMLDC